MILGIDARTQVVVHKNPGLMPFYELVVVKNGESELDVTPQTQGVPHLTVLTAVSCEILHQRTIERKLPWPTSDQDFITCFHPESGGWIRSITPQKGD